jgi:hypothetical protein
MMMVMMVMVMTVMMMVRSWHWRPRHIGCESAHTDSGEHGDDKDGQ